MCCAPPTNQRQVSELHDAARSQHLPHLNALLERCGAVRAFARQELMSDLAHLRDMPAMHLAQRTTCGCCALMPE
jgi:hypothetical protein